MKFSFVIPAHNEEALIGETLDSIFAAAPALHEPFEVIVACDGCTDRTASIVREKGALAVEINARKISAVRNAGAREAGGDVLIFVDADTVVSPEVLVAVRKALDAGAMAGGARVELDGASDIFAHAFVRLFSLLYFRIMRFAAGCFIYARRETFQAAGGFDEQYYISEDVMISRALKRQGRFVIVPVNVCTSGRKARMFSLRQTATLMFRLGWQGTRAWRKRDGLEFWYGGKRETPKSNAVSSSQARP